MINHPAPFPEVSSFALKAEGTETVLARIIAKDGAGNVTISLPHRPGASGVQTLPLAELIDGTALTDEEREEYEALIRQPQKAKRRNPEIERRINRLRIRDIYSAVLDAHLATLPKAKAA